MRMKFVLCGALLTPALLLAGCGMDTMSGPAMNMESPALSGRAFGGQQPIANAIIEVLAMGTTGYGSQATLLASTTSDSNGNFSFASGAYACPQSDTPVYLMGIGGDSGAGPNPYIVTAAGLGTCTNAKSSYVVMNEVTTTALAFALAHFFSPTLGGANGANDSFGGPSVSSGGTIQYSQGLQLGNNYTIPAIVEGPVGAPIQPYAGVTLEVQKIYTIANVLAACINTVNPTRTTSNCNKLFSYTTPPSGGTAPADTLQAAVQMALYPYQNVRKLYNLIGTVPAFDNQLTAQPNDWTIAVSYTSSALGLATDTGTASTLDIDSGNRIWFPSNASGATGAAYFDQTSRSFNGPYNTTGLVHPQQVAVDANGYVWLNDSASTSVSGYLTTDPSLTQSVSFPNVFSNALTIGEDDSIDLGVTNGSTYTIGDITPDRSGYSVAPTISLAAPASSIATDISGTNGVLTTNFINTKLWGYDVTGGVATQQFTSNDDGGQLIYTGNDFIGTRPFSGGGNANDGLCIFSQGKCFGITKDSNQGGAFGIAIDGNSNLWFTESLVDGVVNVPIATPGANKGAVYLNANNRVPSNEYLHDGQASGVNTSTLTRPYGIGIDIEGNVWISNAGCTTTNCAPGSFTLTEIVGAAAPTITPVSAQITSGTNLVGTEPTR